MFALTILADVMCNMLINMRIKTRLFLNAESKKCGLFAGIRLKQRRKHDAFNLRTQNKYIQTVGSFLHYMDVF